METSHQEEARLVYREFEESELHEETTRRTRAETNTNIITIVEARSAEEQEEGVDNLIARSHYRSTLLTRLLQRWGGAREEHQQRRRTQQLVATQCYMNKIKFFFFRAWQWEFNARRYAREAWQVAVNRHTKNVLHKHFQAYRTSVRIRRTRIQIVRLLEYRKFLSLVARYALKLRIYGRQRQAVRYLQRRSIREVAMRTLRKWDHYRKENVEARFFNAELANRHVIMKEEDWAAAWLTDAFAKGWTALLSEKTKYDAFSSALNTRRFSFRLRSAWHHWVLRTRARRTEQLSRIRFAFRAYSRWARWTQHQLSLQCCDELAKRFYDKCLLARWRHAAIKSRVEREKIDAAAACYTRCLGRQAFHGWRRNAQAAKSFRVSFEAAMSLRSQMFFGNALDALLMNLSPSASLGGTGTAATTSSNESSLIQHRHAHGEEQQQQQSLIASVTRTRILAEQTPLVPFHPPPFRSPLSSAQQQQQQQREAMMMMATATTTTATSSEIPRVLFSTPQTLPRFHEQQGQNAERMEPASAITAASKLLLADATLSSSSPLLIEKQINSMLLEFEALSCRHATDKQHQIDIKQLMASQPLPPEQHEELAGQLKLCRDRADRRVYLRNQLERLQEG